MTPDTWRDLVGRHLEERRLELGYSSRYQVADGIPVSETWVRQLESGEVRRNDGTFGTPNPRGNKLRAYLDRLKWPPHAIDDLLAGEDPRSFEAPASVEQKDYNSRIARISDGAQAAIDAIIEAEERKLQR